AFGSANGQQLAPTWGKRSRAARVQCLNLYSIKPAGFSDVAPSAHGPESGADKLNAPGYVGPVTGNDLFSTRSGPFEPETDKPEDAPPAPQPLAARMRPRNLDEFAGQRHILGKGQLLRRAIEADRIQSLIFYGPPGTGKTSLAQIIARQTRSKFERLSGVESNVADMRRVLAGAANRLENTGLSTILFIAEIHRFNKAQQDVLLPDVESGAVRLIGA